ncbi:hypothetical protein PV08_06117 [Exophiala spinifera]|uniref:Enoyl reductase (ER) domain-containing protein n=1 Tax=Exophiala spinifera TaxID=91928 RepID=A0A0D1YM45_9EURO|nr:uncharacterized protein PV08_06117 [Exophiala spinifera]KIW16066.1 hypothetical protein PV08_06117 [Exophiala spinifera]
MAATYTAAVIVSTAKPCDPIQYWESKVVAPEPGGVRLRVIYAGVCGTDKHFWEGAMTFPIPYVLGHEGVGRIEALGEGVTKDHAGKPVAVGDVVYWNPIAPCHACYHCTITKDFTSCANSTFLSPATEPTFASYTEVANLKRFNAFYKLAPSTPVEAVISLGCALPTILQALDNLGGIDFGSDVVVQGSGVLGLASIMMAVLAGAKTITVLDVVQSRLDMAMKFGATKTINVKDFPSSRDRLQTIQESSSCPDGVDLVMECSGRVESFAEGIKMLRTNGKYLVIGTFAGEGQALVDPFELVRKSLRIIGTKFAAPHHYYRAVQLADTYHERFPLAECVSAKVPLRNTEKAFELIASGTVVKVVIDLENSA